MFLSVGELCPQCKIGHIYAKGKDSSFVYDWTWPRDDSQKIILVCDKCGYETDFVATPEQNVVRLVNVGPDGKFPIPQGYELVEFPKLEPAEYFATFFRMPTGEPRVAFYTVEWPRGKTKTYGHQVSQVRLRLIRDKS
jgi:hypothetical protein